MAYSHFVQGLIRIVKRHTLKALPELREAIRVYPYLAAAHCALAYALFLRGKADEAFAAYQEALRIDPRDRDLFLPLLQAFEQVERLKARFATYSELLFPDTGQPVSPVTVPNPVALFLERRTDRVEKALSVLVLGELIEGRPFAVVDTTFLRRARPLPDYVLNYCLPQLEAPMPELSSTWEFLSGSVFRVESRVMFYCSGMEERGFDGEQIRLRLEIVRSFQELCEEMGFIRGEEDDAYDDGMS